MSGAGCLIGHRSFHRRIGDGDYCCCCGYYGSGVDRCCSRPSRHRCSWTCCRSCRHSWTGYHYHSVGQIQTCPCTIAWPGTTTPGETPHLLPQCRRGRRRCHSPSRNHANFLSCFPFRSETQVQHQQRRHHLLLLLLLLLLLPRPPCSSKCWCYSDLGPAMTEATSGATTSVIPRVGCQSCWFECRRTCCFEFESMPASYCFCSGCSGACRWMTPSATTSAWAGEQAPLLLHCWYSSHCHPCCSCDAGTCEDWAYRPRPPREPSRPLPPHLPYY